MTKEPMRGLMPCPFSRGQVWLNPDEEMMMVTAVIAKFGGNCHKVEYLTEEGERGSFYSDDKAITDNIELLSTRATPTPQAHGVEVDEAVKWAKAQIFHLRCTIEAFDCNNPLVGGFEQEAQHFETLITAATRTAPKCEDFQKEVEDGNACAECGTRRVSWQKYDADVEARAKELVAAQSAWLIEWRVNGTPVWYAGDIYEAGWAEDANDAIWFARKQDAEKLIKDCGWNDVKITEHMFG